MRPVFALMILFATWLPSFAAELVMLVDGPARPAIISVADGFKSSTGHSLIFVFASGPALNKRVMDGERADVLITPKRYIDELQAASKAKSADAKLIGGAGISLAVRKGGTVFDISTVDSLRTALLKADAVVFNNVGSGNSFASVVDKLALSHVIAGKIVRIAPDAVFDRIAKSPAAEIAVGATPLILEDGRLQTLGELPEEFQSRLDLFAVPLASAADRNAADALVAYLLAADTKKRLAVSGLK